MDFVGDGHVVTNTPSGGDEAASDTRCAATLGGAMRNLLANIASALGPAGDEQTALARIPAILDEALRCKDLLTPEQRTGSVDSYTRHLIHADPKGRFSVLSIVWMPGQVSPIHGHNAWGVVGVQSGRVENASYQVRCQAPGEQAGYCCVPTGSRCAGAGFVVATPAGDDGAHRLGNPFAETACTIHVYGMDLSLQPTGINRYYD